MEGEGWEDDLEADDVALTEGSVRWHKVLGARHVDFLTRNVAQSVAVRIKAYWGVETCFATSPTYTDMAAVVWGEVAVWVLAGGTNATEDLAFPVPPALSGPHICPCHSKPLFCRDTSTGKVEEDMGGRILKVEARAVWFRFGRSMVLRRWKGRVGDTVNIAESLTVIDTRS